MKTHVQQHHHRILFIIGITIALFGAAAFARIVGWMPRVSVIAQLLASDRLLAVSAAPAAAATAHTTALEARASARCAECGVIESAREMGPQDEDILSSEPGLPSTRSRQIIIRMSDGSSRVIDDPNAARWQPRQRVLVIGGMSPNQ